MTAQQKRLLFENTARAMGDARIEVKQRHIERRNSHQQRN